VQAPEEMGGGKKVGKIAEGSYVESWIGLATLHEKKMLLSGGKTPRKRRSRVSK